MTTGLLRIVSPQTDKPSKRVALNERIEVWIADAEDPDGGRWVDVSGAVRSVRSNLVYGQIASADVEFFGAGVALHDLHFTAQSVEGLRAFLEQIDAADWRSRSSP